MTGPAQPPSAQTAPERAAPRVLLVEFISADRFSQYRSELYPYIAGWLHARGVAVRWPCVAFDPDEQAGDRFRVSPAPDAQRFLLDQLASFAPTHILCNELLSPTLAHAVTTAAPRARLEFHTLADGPELGTVPRLEAWLSAPRLAGLAERDGPHTVDAVRPRWDCVPGPGVSDIAPLVHVLGGPTCVYNAPVTRVEEFRGLDLSSVAQRGGCSFCGVATGTGYPYQTPAVDLALSQIEAALTTGPPERCGSDFLIFGAAVFRRLGQFLERLLESDLPPLSLWFSCRMDELNRRAETLDRLLPRLRVAGHQINIGNAGVENFSPTENQRLNKGIDRQDFERFVDNVRRWESAWPLTFRFTQNGGFGFILFTPWTRVEDLRLNLTDAAALGIEPGSFFYASRVQLLPNRPLTLLAERDGLLAERFDAAAVRAFESGCVTSPEQHELPWRFRTPAMAPVYALFFHVRASHAGLADAAVGDDPGGALVAELLSRLPREERAPERLLGAALDVAEAHPRLGTLAELLAALTAKLEPAITRTDAQRAAEARADREEQLREVLRAAAEETLRRVACHPRRLLRGWEPLSVEGRAGEPDEPRDVPAGRWGQLVLSLGRGDERLVLYMTPRAVTPRAFRATPDFAFVHGEDTPVESEETRGIVDLVARALQKTCARYVTDTSGPERET